jgi:arylsulfatase A-like enzyme
VRRLLALAVVVVMTGCGHSGRKDQPPSRFPTADGVTLPAAPPASRPRPNVVFVLTDDLSSDLLPYLPAVQALQRDGMTFDNYFVSDSLCCPSRASIFTGELPHDTGVFTNTPPDGGQYAYSRHDNERKSFAVSLHDQGYRTALMGKYLNGYGAVDGLVPRGWSDWAATGEGYGGFNYTLNVNGRPQFFGHKGRDYFTDMLATRGARFITSSAQHDEPFFLELATFAPHYPSVAARRDRGRYPDAIAPRGPDFDQQIVNAPRWLANRPPLTLGEVTFIDRQFRHRVRSVIAVNNLLVRIEQRLRATRQLGNTYIVFSSDNGYHMGQHRLLPGKLTAFDNDVRVPLIIAGPGIRGGAHVRAVVQNTDLAPTFEQLAGTAPILGTDGRSLLPFLHDRTPPGWRRWALVEHHRPERSRGERDPDQQSGRSGDPPTYAALCDRWATYVEYRNGEREYYDRRTDPAQLRNAYPDLSRQRRRLLHRTLAQLRRCHGAAQCATTQRRRA